MPNGNEALDGAMSGYWNRLDEEDPAIARVARRDPFVVSTVFRAGWDAAWLSASELIAPTRLVEANALRKYADFLDAGMRDHAYAMDEQDWKDHRLQVGCMRNYADLIEADGTLSPDAGEPNA